MSGALFLVFTDAEGGHLVAVNAAAIEVIEQRDDTTTFVNTGQHSAVVNMPVREVLLRIQERTDEPRVRP